jgi:uncharacterized protein YukE
MKKPEWLYSWTWTEADELRLSGAAKDLDRLAKEIASLAASCRSRGTGSLSSELITDAGTHYEDTLDQWKQQIDSDVVANLRASAAAIRSTVTERKTLWDQFQYQLRKYLEAEEAEKEREKE